MIVLVNRERLLSIKISKKKLYENFMIMSGHFWICSSKNAWTDGYEYEFQYMNKKGEWDYNCIYAINDDMFVNTMNDFMLTYGYRQ